MQYDSFISRFFEWRLPSQVFKDVWCLFLIRLWIQNELSHPLKLFFIHLILILSVDAAGVASSACTLIILRFSLIWFVATFWTYITSFRFTIIIIISIEDVFLKLRECFIIEWFMRSIKFLYFGSRIYIWLGCQKKDTIKTCSRRLLRFFDNFIRF